MSLDHASNPTPHQPCISDRSYRGQTGSPDWNRFGGVDDRVENPDGIQTLRTAHLSSAANLFRDVFPDNPLALLGHRFVEDLLASFISIPEGCGLVYLRDGEVAGFIVGSKDSRRHRRQLMLRYWPSLLRASVRAVLVCPSRIWPVAQYLRSYVVSALQWQSAETVGNQPLPRASLIFLGVDRRHRRSGIATILTEAFLHRMGARGVESVKLVVASTNREALRFYLTRGWRESGCFPTPKGGQAYRLTYDLRTREAAPSDSASRLERRLGD